jgi:hypothetical protein
VSHIEISLDKEYVIGLFSQNFNKRNFFKKIMTRDEFERQCDNHFHKTHRSLVAKYKKYYLIPAEEILNKTSPYNRFLGFFVDMKWKEVNDKR